MAAVKGSPTQGSFEDLVAALVFIVVGLGAFIIALGYDVGTVRRMGPGVLPLLVSGLLTLFGVGLAIQTLAMGKLKSIPAFMPKFETLRGLFFVMAALLVFALLVRPAGLFVATMVQAFIATRAERGRGILGSLALSFCIAVLAAAVFIYGIGLPIPLWPW